VGCGPCELPGKFLPGRGKSKYKGLPPDVLGVFEDSQGTARK
jgi:hypothetical protein